MGLYHRSGAVRARDAEGDGLHGLYTKDQAYRVIIDSEGFGLYHNSQAYRVTDVTEVEDYVGVHGKDGSINVTFVTGDTKVTSRAKNGSMTMFLET